MKGTRQPSLFGHYAVRAAVKLFFNNNVEEETVFCDLNQGRFTLWMVYCLVKLKASLPRDE